MNSFFVLLLIAFLGALSMLAAGFGAAKDQGPQRGDSCQDADCYCIGTERDCK